MSVVEEDGDSSVSVGTLTPIPLTSGWTASIVRQDGFNIMQFAVAPRDKTKYHITASYSGKKRKVDEMIQWWGRNDIAKERFVPLIPQITDTCP